MKDSQQTEINWIKESITRIEKAVAHLSNKLDMYRENFATREDATEAHKRLEEAICKKADQSDLDELKGTMTWLARLVIGGVVTGILALVLTQTNIL